MKARSDKPDQNMTDKSGQTNRFPSLRFLLSLYWTHQMKKSYKNFYGFCDTILLLYNNTSFLTTQNQHIETHTIHIEKLHSQNRRFLHPLREEKTKRKVLGLQRLSRVGGRNRARINDPIDVNDVLSARATFVREKDEFLNRLRSR